MRIPNCAGNFVGHADAEKGVDGKRQNTEDREGVLCCAIECMRAG
jgi:hypothetical protein